MKGKPFYLIKWMRFGPEHNTWEPESNIYCTQMVDDFNRAAKERKLDVPHYTSKVTFEELLRGAEGPPIRVVPSKNGKPLEPPKNFVYVNECIYGKNVPPPSIVDMVGCNCTNCYSEKDSCICSRMNISGFPYDSHGALKVPHGLAIHECNYLCKCGPDCPNRIIQKGRQYALALIRHNDGRGFGVLADEDIPANRFLVQYTGEIITSKEATRRCKFYSHSERTYFFDLDHQYAAAMDCDFTIDACRFGNISHFFNHSCDPNLRIVPCYINQCDPRLHNLSFFSTRKIKKGEELTFDYLGPLEDEKKKTSGGKDKEAPKPSNQIKCLCGASNCRKFVFA